MKAIERRLNILLDDIKEKEKDLRATKNKAVDFSINSGFYVCWNTYTVKKEIDKYR